ncbi:hypothetical protein PENARI_c012G11556 [Penicillium arizonense]|uniref:Multicopper oxidase n=1 Tax=Penicillium arizonense TaxID=1835702 RepID=A0A1F5LEU6_PENAI|nr:hypothetical protein PENARI_c012G11556 [Penicillium arizonense]OGE51743.1 hypothetical protein PENARI_c012G11556 [Penicillium arizonense]
MKLSMLLCFAGLSSALLSLESPKRFVLNLTWDTRAPDGVERKQALINGQFPGPPLLMDEGDKVEVTVNNYLPYNTTIHYHGLEQQGTSWSDGVPGVSQRLIPPGGKFVSKFTVTQYGTYWYHSHSAGQIMDGLYGPIYIRPRTAAKDMANAMANDTLTRAQIYQAIKDPKLVMLSDWFHNTSEELREIALDADIDTLCTDSLLVNGRGRVRCVDPGYASSLVPPALSSLLQGKNYTAKGNTYAQTTYAQHNYSAVPSTMYNECNATDAEEAVIQVESWKGWASLNFIGSAGISVPTVSINNHSLWVYEVDGQYIQPIRVDALALGNGGRYSALVKLNNTAGDYPIIVANSGLNQKIAGRATLSYAHGDPTIDSTPSINYGGNRLTSDVVVLDENTIKPLIPNKPSQHADETYLLNIGRYEKAWRWSLNGDHAYDLALEAERPMLWDPQSQENSSLVIATKNNTWVDIIFKVFGNSTTLQPGHPLHKHSNPVYVLGSGTGEFNYTSVAEAVNEIPESFNLVDPPIPSPVQQPSKDRPGWRSAIMALRNPGAFFMHCHIDPHLTGGMALAMLDGVDTWPTVPAQYGPQGHWGKAA